MARPTRAQGTVRRTRSGCITCKIRHVKCDEAKPICQRCATNGYKCDGYDQFKQLTSDDFAKKTKSVQTKQRPLIPRTSQETTIQLSRTLQRYLLPHPATPTLQLSSNNVENNHLYHVRTCVIRDMAAVARSTKFWHIYVLPLSHSSPAIRQALCALGAAHRCFISDRHESSRLLLSQNDFVTEAMQCYNDAITALNTLVSSSDTTGAHLDVVLICCVVFITIENLHGRSAAAACHLRAGCDIVKRFRSAPAGAIAHRTAGRGDDMVRFLLVLQDMLYGFGQCLSSYVGLDLFADLDFGMPVSDPGRPAVPFASLGEAETMLANIDRAFYTRMWKAEAYSPQPSNVADVFADRTRSLESQGPKMNLTYRRTAKMATAQDFLVWRERCEPLLARKDGDARRVASLALDRGIWGIILVDGSSCEPFPSDKCHEVLSLAEDVVRTDASAADRRPLFTCEGMLIWALYYICYGSEDRAVRKRCIALLRVANRREGLWDSRDVATICETAEAALDSGAITWRDIPHGVLTLADMLHVRPRGFSLESVRDLGAQDTAERE